MPLAEALQVTLQVVEVLEALDIPYLVGGSLASSLHGRPRSTHDADILIQLEVPQVARLVALLEPDFHADGDTIRDAVRRSTCCNVIHRETFFKVDLFVAGDEPLALEELRRRQRFPLPGVPHQDLVVATAEDTVLRKLHWYKLGGEVSERQWRDVLGVLQVQGGELDRDYLERWARTLDLQELLERVLEEVGGFRTS